MPIVERTARQCFDRFAGHVRPLFAATVSAKHPVLLTHVSGATVATLTFGGADGSAVQLRTKLGRIYLYASQELEAVPEGKSAYRLRTVSYWYRLQSGPELTAKNGVLRWEYGPGRSDGGCRHHVHAPVIVPLGTGLDLDKAHLPTGWVTLEEVIRFLIVDLGHKPPCGDTWAAVLADSERAFFEEFTGKRYKAPR